MALYLIRCARAERRAHWKGPDELRPLTDAGRAQAAGLVEWLGNVAVSHVASSPFARCVETVRPLAEAHELEVEQLDSLAPTQDVEPILAWLRVIPDSSVLCSHGAVIARVMEILTRQGAEASTAQRTGAREPPGCSSGRATRCCVPPPPPDQPVRLAQLEERPRQVDVGEIGLLRDLEGVPRAVGRIEHVEQPISSSARVAASRNAARPSRNALRRIRGAPSRAARTSVPGLTTASLGSMGAVRGPSPLPRRAEGSARSLFDADDDRSWPLGDCDAGSRRAGRRCGVSAGRRRRGWTGRGEPGRARSRTAP